MAQTVGAKPGGRGCGEAGGHCPRTVQAVRTNIRFLYPHSPPTYSAVMVYPPPPRSDLSSPFTLWLRTY